MDSLEKVIINTQKHITTYQPNPPNGLINYKAPINNHEASTRYILIDPILKALGWELSNPSECIIEYPVKVSIKGRPASRIDYILLDNHTNLPAVAIEAKRININTLDSDALDQITKYLSDLPTVHTAVITNGQYWTIATKKHNNEWTPESQYPLGIHYKDTKNTANRLYNTLSKDIVSKTPQSTRTTFKQAFKNNHKPTNKPYTRFKSAYLKNYNP